MKTLFLSLLLMLGITMAGSLQVLAQDTQKEKPECAAQADLAEATFKVDGLCSMCMDRIEKAAKGVNGVKKASWNKESKMLTLGFHKDKVKMKNVHEAIAQAGHDTEKVTASDEAYASLPMCCKYRED